MKLKKSIQQFLAARRGRAKRNQLLNRTERRRGIRGALSRHGFTRISYTQSSIKGDYVEVWRGVEGTITVQWEVS